MEEDFPTKGGGEGGEGGEVVECYLLKLGSDEMENCVVKSECPSDYPGVCCLRFNFIFN
jgi:hypothetical protein